MKMRYLEMGPYPIYVGFAPTNAVFQKELKRLGITEELPFISPGNFNSATLYTLENPKNVKATTCICCFDLEGAKKHTAVEIAGLCAHEAVHVWQRCRDSLGEKNPGDEQEAYFIHWVCQFFMENVLRYVKPKLTSVK